jgi:phage antirepressor YoqD-like protein
VNEQLSVFDGEKKMFLTQVAGALGVNDRTIQRYAKKLFPGLVKNGTATKLSELQVTKIKLELEKAKNLDTAVELPKTDLEKELLIRQAMQFQDEKINNLQSQLEQAKPAIEFHKQVGDSSGLHTIAEAAKMLGTGRNRLFGKLRGNNVLRDNNEPYQRFIESGYFEIKENPYNEHINAQTFVTAKGFIWLQRFFRKEQKG